MYSHHAPRLHCSKLWCSWKQFWRVFLNRCCVSSGYLIPDCRVKIKELLTCLLTHSGYPLHQVLLSQCWIVIQIKQAPHLSTISHHATSQNCLIFTFLFPLVSLLLPREDIQQELPIEPCKNQSKIRFNKILWKILVHNFKFHLIRRHVLETCVHLDNLVSSEISPCDLLCYDGWRK